ncbi:MAG: hypothetical protein HKN71_10250 [Gemmatimonadetes bacterium]|nr:hypothetical protein [Gemmatimonadota bacterium]
MPTNVRDPRSIITPDAFELSEALLGTPLAGPWRRLWAMLIDIVVIGVLTAVTASISLILWGGVALFLIVMAFRAPGRDMSSVASMLFRGATGCLGTVILIGVLIGYLFVQANDEVIERGGPGIVAGISEGFGAALSGFEGLATLNETDDPDEAVRLLRSFVDLTGGAMNEEGLRELVDEAISDEAPWLDQDDAVYARVFGAVDGLSAPSEDDAPEAADAAADEATAEADAVAAIAELSDSEALVRLADFEARPDSLPIDGADAAVYAALRERLAPVVASDTLDALADELDDTQDDLSSTEARLADAQAEIDEGRAGFLGLIRDIWEQAGSAIGLWSVYFTVALTVTRGRTVGKKLMGLRVLRLDGEPLNWWASFERAGGYVAGIATGTLGFVQVFWDPNRQCVHDKIVGTVVVVDGAGIEPGAWQEAWAVQESRRGRGSDSSP